MTVEEVAEVIRLDMTTPGIRCKTRYANAAKALAKLGTIRIVGGEE
jgi:hypothetical protein